MHAKKQQTNAVSVVNALIAQTFVYSWTIWTKIYKLIVKAIFAIQIYSSNDVYTFSIYISQILIEKQALKKRISAKTKTINRKKLIVHLKLVSISTLIQNNMDADLGLVFF